MQCKKNVIQTVIIPSVGLFPEKRPKPAVNNKLVVVALCLFILTCSLQLSAQGITADTGTVGGARYRILMPPDWETGGQKKLVMYAHGYEFMGTPSGIDNPQFAQGQLVFLDRGFAVAASAYRGQGYMLPEGIEDTEALRKYFVNKYGRPDSTFIVGHSMGGGVAIGATEKYGSSYHGALPLCPLASRPYLQTRKEFDLFVVFNVLFPGLIPELSDIMDQAAGGRARSMQEVFASAGKLQAEIMRDSVLAKQLAHQFDLKLKDLPFTLLFGENVLRDVAQKAGGNPFDNTKTLYSGFPDDWMVNQKAERLAAAQSAFQFLNKYSPTGEISIPVVMMHTIYDQLIPPRLAVNNYVDMVQQQGKSDWLAVKYTDGRGHCQFSPQQTGEAFDALRRWVKKGNKPESGALAGKR